MSKEQEYKEKIKDSLDSVLEAAFVPELGEHKKGKVRDIHFSGDNIVMIASDRVSAFDVVLSRAIPYKGAVLNAFNQWAMEITSDIIQNASVQSPDPNVVVQKKLENANFEFIVRGYVWGSLAADYEAGRRTKCGIQLPEGMLRYQKLPEPIFTPTDKAEVGHDEDLTLDDIALAHNREMAERLRDISIQLYKRGAEHAERAGMILLDTKFEFGLDEHGNIFLIDESLTPDSSRYCSKEEFGQKWPQIVEAMKSGKYENVSALIKERPELKITEQSKQFVRDVLLESGYEHGGEMTRLTDEQVIETSWRYIVLYEQLTGKTFDFNKSELPNARKRIMNNLVKANLAYGACVVPLGASEKDSAHWEKLEKALKDNDMPYTPPFIKSAHKDPVGVANYVKDMTARSIEPLVFLTWAGESNGHGPVVAAATHYPTITCPAFKDIADYSVNIHSSTRMPSNLPLMTVVRPGNAVLAAKNILDMVR